MDRGIPTEATLKEMREPDNKISYLVGAKYDNFGG
jgi:hypothetical protein